MNSTPSSSDPEFNPGGMVPDGPMYVDRRELPGPIIRTADVPQVLEQLAAVRASVDAFTRHMAAQDPELLEQDRAEAWGFAYDPTRQFPDAMVVTYDRTTEK